MVVVNLCLARLTPDADHRPDHFRGVNSWSLQATQDHPNEIRSSIPNGAARGSISLGDKVLGIPTVLEEDSRGVRYEVPLFPTSYNRDLAPGLKAGAYGSSFRFNVTAEDYNKRAKASDYNPQGLPERTVRELHMPEFGPMTFPAYEGASAGMRSLTDRFYPFEGARPSRRSESVFEEFLQLIEH